MTETTGATVGVGRRAWRRIASVPVRLLLSLGLVLGFAAVGTTAYWADTATLHLDTIQAGTLDLQLGGRNPVSGDVMWGAVGTDEDLFYAVTELDNVAPGESVAMELYLRNAGSTPLEFTATGETTTNAMNPYLTADAVLDGEANNSGSGEEVDRTGVCTGGTITWWDDQVLSTTPVPVFPAADPIRLDPDDQLRVCVVAAFSADAPNEYQGATTSIRVVVSAKQVGAP